MSDSFNREKADNISDGYRGSMLASRIVGANRVRFRSVILLYVSNVHHRVKSSIIRTYPATHAAWAKPVAAVLLNQTDNR